MERFRVIYSIKIEGLLTEKQIKFDTLQDAMKFVRSMQRNNAIFGKPTIERA